MSTASCFALVFKELPSHPMTCQFKKFQKMKALEKLFGNITLLILILTPKALLFGKPIT